MSHTKKKKKILSQSGSDVTGGPVLDPQADLVDGHTKRIFIATLCRQVRLVCREEGCAQRGARTILAVFSQVRYETSGDCLLALRMMGNARADEESWISPFNCSPPSSTACSTSFRRNSLQLFDVFQLWQVVRNSDPGRVAAI